MLRSLDFEIGGFAYGASWAEGGGFFFGVCEAYEKKKRRPVKREVHLENRLAGEQIE